MPNTRNIVPSGGSASSVDAPSTSGTTRAARSPRRKLVFPGSCAIEPNRMKSNVRLHTSFLVKTRPLAGSGHAAPQHALDSGTRAYMWLQAHQRKRVSPAR